MSFLTLIPAEAHEELAKLPLPPLAFAAIAAGIFIVLALVSWSFRDVAHRHNDKTSAQTDSQNAQH